MGVLNALVELEKMRQQGNQNGFDKLGQVADRMRMSNLGKRFMQKGDFSAQGLKQFAEENNIDRIEDLGTLVAMVKAYQSTLPPDPEKVDAFRVTPEGLHSISALPGQVPEGFMPGKLSSLPTTPKLAGQTTYEQSLGELAAKMGLYAPQNDDYGNQYDVNKVTGRRNLVSQAPGQTPLARHMAEQDKIKSSPVLGMSGGPLLDKIRNDRQGKVDLYDKAIDKLVTDKPRDEKTPDMTINEATSQLVQIAYDNRIPYEEIERFFADTYRKTGNVLESFVQTTEKFKKDNQAASAGKKVPTFMFGD